MNLKRLVGIYFEKMICDAAFNPIFQKQQRDEKKNAYIFTFILATENNQWNYLCDEANFPRTYSSCLNKHKKQMNCYLKWPFPAISIKIFERWFVREACFSQYNEMT